MDPMLRRSPWLALLKSVNGRDKLIRLIQYALRMSRGLSPRGYENVSDRALAVESAIAQARQVGRLIKWIHILEKQWKASPDKGIGFDILQAGMDAGLFGFFLLDNLTWLTRTGKLASPEWIRQNAHRSYISWNISNIFGSFASILHLIQLRRFLAKSTTSASQRAAIHREMRIVFIRLLRFLLDAVVSANLVRNTSGRKGLTPWKVSWVGACGVASSAIALWDQWPEPPKPTSPHTTN
uniref:Uncharacterized protein n=1 Tax=Compsopogon caeruleus TaxID=31354 RepID=A0A7S1XGY8_9RHOD|mmetsp:Transcript_7785/g.15710  ORF Transcript_7785/g.15710 Transcript_7785/m.15710 type:complete len:239 (+) Transcript_7785:97-813(+)